MRSDEQRYKTIGLMIFAVIIIFSVVGIVIIGFKMVKKNEDAKLVAAVEPGTSNSLSPALAFSKGTSLTGVSAVTVPLIRLGAFFLQLMVQSPLATKFFVLN